MYVLVWWLPGLGYYKLLFLFFSWKISRQLDFVCLVKTLTLNAGKCNLVNHEKPSIIDYSIPLIWSAVDQVGPPSIAKVKSTDSVWWLRESCQLTRKLQSLNIQITITLVGLLVCEINFLCPAIQGPRDKINVENLIFFPEIIKLCIQYKSLTNGPRLLLLLLLRASKRTMLDVESDQCCVTGRREAD